MMVEVYKNITKNTFSIRSKASQRVVLHGDVVVLSKVYPVVREGGRQRVLREKKKNVHAFLSGILMDYGPISDFAEGLGECGGFFGYHWKGQLARYNPYSMTSFALDSDPWENGSVREFCVMKIDKGVMVWE